MQQREELPSSAQVRSRAGGWMAGRTSGEVARSSLDGLWLVLVEGQEQQKLGPTFEGRVPMMARAGDDQTYLLGFRNMHSARKFLASSPVAGAEPRLVVKSNKDELLRVARASGAVGVLVDYNPETSAYSSAAALF
jgi:hypothetical protein